MNPEPERTETYRREPPSPLLKLLEQATACILVLVLASLVWMLVVSQAPTWARLASPAAEVWIVLGLLTAALVLVSVVALLHSRG